MASAPFDIAATAPGDDDVASQFPALERDFRDIVESWLLVEHDTYGHHKMPSLTTTERDADTHWSVGSMLYNETLKNLQIATGTGPMVWLNASFETGTRCLFQQTAAPTGWTKETDAAYTNAAIIGTTGTVGTGGSTGFDAVMTSRTILQANLPSYNLTVTDPGHTHDLTFSQGTAAGPGSFGGSLTRYASTTDTTAGAISNTTGISVASGGSGTAMDFAVKYYAVITAEKD